MRLFITLSLAAVAAGQTMDSTGMMEGVMKCSGDITSLYTSGPCANVGMTAMAGAGTGLSADVYQSICTTACYPAMKAAYQKMGDCMSKVIGDMAPKDAPASTMGIYDNMGGMMVKSMEFMCTKNPATGNYCMADYSPTSMMVPSIGGGSDDSLSPTCGMYADMGCCFGSMMSVANAAGAGAGAVTSIYTSLCGWESMPRACPAPGETVKLVKATFALPSLDWTHYSGLSVEEQRSLKAALVKDFAGGVGTDSSRVSLGNLVAAGSGTQLEVILTPNDNNAASGLETSVTSALGSVDWTETQKLLPAEAPPVKAEQMQVSEKTAVGEGQSPTTQGTQGSAAAALRPSLAFAIFLGLLALSH